MKNLCVFCGSSSGAKPSFLELAAKLGKEMAQKKIQLVYGGANIGLMGELANSCLNSQGKVLGVMPQTLIDFEVAHQNLTEFHIVDTMHERKEKMYHFSDAFLAIPGGTGTLDELCEILTWAQIGYHQKPCYILNFEDYYKHLLAQFDYMEEMKFLKPQHRKLLIEVKTTEEFWKKSIGHLIENSIAIL